MQAGWYHIGKSLQTTYELSIREGSSVWSSKEVVLPVSLFVQASAQMWPRLETKPADLTNNSTAVT